MGTVQSIGSEWVQGLLTLGIDGIWAWPSVMTVRLINSSIRMPAQITLELHRCPDIMAVDRLSN